MRHRLTQLLNSVWYGRNPLWILLWPISLVYRILFSLSRRRAVRTRRGVCAVPVVVVGNICVGGTGKTPLVIWLARELRERGKRVGVISRGYGGARIRTAQIVGPEGCARNFGDEPVLISQATGCPVAVCAQRIEARDLLVSQFELDVILSDDGLQHSRLERACELVVVDGARGLGNGLCLPAGPLREPAGRLARVDAVVVNGDGWSYPGAIRARIRPLEAVRLADEASRTLEAFRGQTVHAVAGIGNPRRFFDLLWAHGILVIEHPLADHARIDTKVLQGVGDAPVMITEKDAVKSPLHTGPNTWCLKIAMHIDEPDKSRLLDVVERCIRGNA